MTKGVLPRHVQLWRHVRCGSPTGVAAVFCILLAIPCMAFTTKFVVDVLKWRDAGAAARSVAASDAAAERSRIEAQVVMRRDICAGIQVLRANSTRDDDVGAAARNALTMIAEELR